MEIQTLKVNEINPAVYNPRKDLKPGDPEYEKLKKSILEFDMVEPLVWNKRTGNLVGGHQRLKILKELGIEKVEVSIVDLSEVKEKALNIALNKIQGEWDLPALKDLLEELDTGAFDMEITGFDLKEIEDLMTQFYTPEEGLTDDDAVPEPTESICRRGDLWQLGNHRLLCGDATVKADVEKLMGGEKADMVFTDPPYDMQMGGQGCWAKSTKNVKKRIDKIINFDVSILSFLPSLHIPSYYICTSKDGIPTYFDIFKGYNFNILIWCKTNPTPFTAGTFLPDVEYILFFGAKGEYIWNNSLKPTEVYKKYYISKKEFGRDGVGDLMPTMKPVEMIANRVMISSHSKGGVLDLFGGSGSTLIACEKLGRKCYMMEIDEHYCDVIIKRWEDFTGKKVVYIDG